MKKLKQHLFGRTVPCKLLLFDTWGSRAGIFKQSMGARNRVIKPARQATQAGEIHSLESIPGLNKRLKIPLLEVHVLSPVAIRQGGFAQLWETFQP